ncbi:hypothetical protein [Siphonobacter sp. SORGH_AS_1065]|uniref:hypothetical protein n=1 Tax=Siphonobacter sp. SORGH_AS_1065 TaxID=3041795 RepID=UPI002787A55C|nr:hypothetical protein [Siphonobacter sp. SORGH_AS_1065]MDQ1089714.1 hypothetical protein [Siphonobacter sp. SORGH_AS_1065]
MNEAFDILYYFTNQAISIIEVKRTDLANATDKSQVYFWLKWEHGRDEISRLNFVSMQVSSDSEERVFEEGLLHFNTEQALYTDLDTFDTETLQTQRPDLIPESFQSILTHYFQSQ